MLKLLYFSSVNKCVSARISYSSLSLISGIHLEPFLFGCSAVQCTVRNITTEDLYNPCHKLGFNKKPGTVKSEERSLQNKTFFSASSFLDRVNKSFFLFKSLI